MGELEEGSEVNELPEKGRDLQPVEDHTEGLIVPPDRLRISTDTRYQLASDPIDERWIGDTPGNWDIRDKRGMVC